MPVYWCGSSRNIGPCLVCTGMIHQGPYSQYVMLFLCNLQIDQLVRLLHCTWLESLAREKHSNLLDPSISNGENRVLLIQPHYADCHYAECRGAMAQAEFLVPQPKLS